MKKCRFIPFAAKTIVSALLIFILTVPVSAQNGGDTRDRYEKIETWNGLYSYIDLGDSVAIVKYTGYDYFNVVIPDKINGKKVTEISPLLPEGSGIAQGAFYESHFFYSSGIPIRSIVIPEGVEKIGAYSFYDCEYLTSVTLPSTLKTISPYAFAGCRRLQTVNFSEGLQSIGEEAFYGCQWLGEVDLPSSLKYIGKHAFENCKYLGTVNMKQGLVKIAEGAFEGCIRLTEAAVPDTVKIIGNRVFSGCPLTELYIPSGVGQVGALPFETLDDLYFGGDINEFESVFVNGFYRQNGYYSDLDDFTYLSVNADEWLDGITFHFNSPSPFEEKTEVDRVSRKWILAVGAVLAAAFLVDFLIISSEVRKRKRTLEEKAAFDFSVGKTEKDILSDEEKGGFVFEQLGQWKCGKCGCINGVLGKYCYNCGTKKDVFEDESDKDED